MSRGKFIGEHFLSYELGSANKEIIVNEDDVKIYFERNSADPSFSYRLFLTFKAWNNLLLNEVTPLAIDSLQYQKVEVSFDVSSYDCASLTNRKSKYYQKAERKIEMDVERYLANGGVLEISQLEDFFSGVGQIIFYKKKDDKYVPIEKFFFAVNDIKRININYVILKHQDGLLIKAECFNKATKVRVCLNSNKNRLPCLAIDKNYISSFQLDFSESSRVEQIIPLEEKYKNYYFALNFENESNNDLYILNLLYEDSFPSVVLNDSKDFTKEVCPYCGEHLRPVSARKAYETGAISCSSISSELSYPKIYDEAGKQVSHIAYCKGDLIPKGDKLFFDTSRKRLLPVDFFEKKHFKVAMLGSVRSGKSVFLSRLFGLTKNGDSVDFSMKYISNFFKKYDLSLYPANCFELENRESGGYTLKKNNYYASSNYFKSRVIDIEGSFPHATTTGEQNDKYPFILGMKHANEDAYITFSDISGEEARNKKAFGDVSAVVVLINALKDVDGNNAIINSLIAANLPKDTPIAVILTKLDIVGKNFSPSSHIIRSNYYDIDSSMPYEKGIGREILCSSMETKSYLDAESMLIMLDEHYDNVSYFALANFSFSDSIHRPGSNNENEPGQLLFENSPKRLELPLLWLAKQFKLF